jgi:hypothetical protein
MRLHFVQSWEQAATLHHACVHLHIHLERSAKDAGHHFESRHKRPKRKVGRRCVEGTGHVDH